MRFLSVCSGIEAASVAWAPFGWKAAAFSEIDAFPCSVLAYHYPDVPNHGDMTKFKDWPDHAIDLLCGGTPCQSFSNAGLRAGLDDPRGQLMLTYGAIAARYRTRWLVWENVPGVLSSNEGQDFGSFLGLLGFLGYGFAYRILDAQYVRVDGYGRAVPQRRNRVFVVGCLGDWRSAAAVLFEREGLRGDSAPRREAGAHIAATLTRGAESSGKGGYAGRRQEDDVNIVAGVAPTLPSRAKSGGGMGTDFDCDGGLIAAASMCLNAKGGGGRLDAESETLIPTNGGGIGVGAIAFNARQDPINGPINGPIDCHGGSNGVMVPLMQVRRLMPVECERLMGFPDGYTAIQFRGKPVADGPRYKALGNSWAVNCARWIGRRIHLLDTYMAA